MFSNIRTIEFDKRIALPGTIDLMAGPRGNPEKHPEPRQGGRGPGRPPAAEREQLEQRLLDLAERELVERGAGAFTMDGVAARAGASKGTLYAWFGNREGLLRIVIERNADRAAEGVRAALAGDAPAPQVLTGFAHGLLTLLTGEVSIALNRAAMSTPTLAQTLLESGRFRIGPLVEEYLRQAHRRGELHVPDAAAAFRQLYGLIVQDAQIIALLGGPAPGRERVRRQARQAVEAFLSLHQAPADRPTP